MAASYKEQNQAYKDSVAIAKTTSTASAEMIDNVF
jgi:hypothetical protein